LCIALKQASARAAHDHQRLKITSQLVLDEIDLLLKLSRHLLDELMTCAGALRPQYKPRSHPREAVKPGQALRLAIYQCACFQPLRRHPDRFALSAARRKSDASDALLVPAAAAVPATAT
jgi:hypothetical protein